MISLHIADCRYVILECHLKSANQTCRLKDLQEDIQKEGEHITKQSATIWNQAYNVAQGIGFQTMVHVYKIPLPGRPIQSFVNA